MMITQPDQSLDAMRQCLAKVTEGSSSEALTEGLDYKVLNEVNFNGSFGFLPKNVERTRCPQHGYILEDFMEILRISGLGLPEKEGLSKSVKAMQVFCWIIPIQAPSLKSSETTLE